MILYGDIGGTKTQLLTSKQLLQSDFHVEHFENRQYQSFNTLLEQFLASQTEAVSQLYLSVAGPVAHNTCQLTNLDWLISGEQLCKAFGFQQVQLLNDLSATAYAIAKLGSEDYIVLQNELPKLKDAPIAVLSVGTGLGESVLLWIEELQSYRSVGGEGGHRNFAPRTRLEQSLSEFIQEQDGVSFFDGEILMSGQGLTRIYDFFVSTNPSASSKQRLEPWQVVAQAEQENDANATRALEMLIDLIASEAANLALQYYSSGGVVIAGGIPKKIAEHIDTERFIRRFQQHATFSPWLQQVPVVICTNYYAPLLGLHYYRETLG